MNRRLFWKLCFTFVTSVVAMFYLIDKLSKQAENAMSDLALNHQIALKDWGKEAGALHTRGNGSELEVWLNILQEQENTWAAVVSFEAKRLSGDTFKEKYYTGYNNT